MLLNDLTGPAHGHEFAVVHDSDSIAEELRFITFRGRQEQSACACILVNCSNQLVLGDWVNALKRVVENYKLRLADECHR